MIGVVRKIEFCAGHRVVGHEGKCQNLHGHNYTVYVHCQAPELDQVGRVIDFSVIKDVCKGWIDANWDHKFLAWEHDDLIDALLSVPNSHGIGPSALGIYWVDYNPTAENLATDLLKTFKVMLKGRGVEVTKIELWETPNCKAVVK